MTEEKRKIILERLKIKDVRNINNILKHEELCYRIINEKPISITAFLERKVMSSYTLNKIIDTHLISCFSNSQKSIRFIFENEIEPFIDHQLMYDNGAIKTLKYIGQFILKHFDCYLHSPRDLEIMKCFLGFNEDQNLSYILKKFFVTKKEAVDIFERTLKRITMYSRSVEIKQILMMEKNDLLNDIKILKSQKKHLYDRITKIQKKYSLTVPDDLNKLKLELSELDLNTRTFNCLWQTKIGTIGDLIQLSPTELMEIRNFGRESLDNVTTALAKFNLKLREEYD